MIEKLERQQLPELTMDESLLKMRNELGAKAYRVLQYKGIGSSIPFGTIENALHKVGVAPFTKASVKLYQYKMLLESQRKVLLRNFICRDRGIVLVVITAILSFLSLIFGFVFGFTEKGPHLFSVVWSVLTSGWAVPVLFWIPLLLYTNHVRDTYGPNVVATHRWVSIAIENYNREIPEFALSTAVQLAELLPYASFHIEELYQENLQLLRPTPDPFLVMDCGGVRYYLHVWDEPKFEHRKKV